MLRFLILSSIIAFTFATSSLRQSGTLAPGRPGNDAHWATARKDGFGTANNLASKVWFTLADGMLTEVYYPTLDVPNVQALQLIVVTPQGRVENEQDDTIHSIEQFDQGQSLTYRQTNRAKTGEYIITKDYVTDPARNVLLIDVSFRSWRTWSHDYKLLARYDPSLNNSGMHDSGWSETDGLLASDGDVASALVSKPTFSEVHTGYVGNLQLDKDRANDGNIVQIGRPGSPGIMFGNWIRFTLALGFGKTGAEALAVARVSLAKDFRSIQQEYQSTWHAYVADLPKLEERYQKQFNVAAMVLTALEDKTHRGAFIASPSIPWGGGPNANEPTVTGYHSVWPRDLYHVATAFLAIGDRPAANRALDYLFKVQQKPDGSFPQNSRVDGRPLGSGLQMDQVALPLVLAYQLERYDRQTWSQHIKKAADFILKNGPRTEQERWEEESGYSPSTIAAEIAGLVCAAETAKRNGAMDSATEYLRVADLWAANVDRWTATTNGSYSDSPYYLRITATGNPNVGAKIEINSNGGTFDQRQIVDAGFLELVRLGIKRADDPLVIKSLAVIDKLIMVYTPRGDDGWYRYNHDAYGEREDGIPYDARSGRGRLWTLLTGERGEYELARNQPILAQRRLNELLRFANEGGMLPEQVWDREVAGFAASTGTGSATPLAWSMAQFIRLAVSLRQGYNVETPKVVAQRYLNRKN